MPAPPPDDALRLTTELLSQLGAGPPSRIEPITGGRNNRAFRVTDGTVSWLMKQYFHDATGGRDRCASEWAWASFCWRQRVTSVPQPFAVRPDQHAALFEFVAGRRLERHEIEAAHVELALAFVIEVNGNRLAPEAAALPEAAEACFSIRAHLDCVEQRVRRLLTLSPNDSLDEQLQEWLRADLEPTWRTLASHVERQFTPEELSRPLTDDERILSPSDFGFHNALLEPTGRLRFLDFEYAGWDDPAKLICDFYWQQDCPAPRETLPLWFEALGQGSSVQGQCLAESGRDVGWDQRRFAAPAHHDVSADEGGGPALEASLSHPTIRKAIPPSSVRDLERRVELLFPVYGVKWCCIVLNEFLAADRQRREFARPTTVRDDRRGEQLELARRLLADVCGRD